MDNTKPAGEDILRVEHVSNYYSDNGLGILRSRKRSQVLQDVSLKIEDGPPWGTPSWA